MSPRFVIDRMLKIVATHGTSQAYSNSRFKKEREAWISAVWSLGLSEIDEHEYWIEIETVEQTPDTKVHYIDQSAGYNHRMTHNIEVVDWEEHVDHPMQVIRKKCERAYPPYFTLLVFARSGSEKILDPHKLSDEVRQLNVPFGEIWILGRTSDSMYTMLKLHPNEFWIGVDVKRALEQPRRRKDFLIFQKRGKGMEVQDLGQIYLSIP